MTRLQKIALSVALLGLGGTGVVMVAVTPSTVSLPQVPDNDGPEVHWFVAINNAYDPTPEAEAVLLTEGGGRGYEYKLSTTAIDGWRLGWFRGAPGFRAQWAAAAQAAGPSMLKAWRSYKDLEADCLALTTAANCLTLAREVNDCWRVSATTVCLEGRKYGPGLGGVTAAGVPVTCTPGEIASATPIPCVIAYGRSESDVSE